MSAAENKQISWMNALCKAFCDPVHRREMEKEAERDLDKMTGDRVLDSLKQSILDERKRAARRQPAPEKTK